MPHEVRVVEVAETGSTNADAMRLALAGEDLPLWVRADRQTAGRGRSGRSWIATEGALLASLAIRLGCPPQMAAQLSLVAGIAALDAILAATAGPQPPRASLKWPNDIMIGDAKAGGILVETARRGADLVAVVGFGINLRQAPDNLDRPVAALTALGPLRRPMEVLAYLAPAMQHWLQVWDEGLGFPAIRSAWLQRAPHVGAAITVDCGEGPRTGIFAGLDADGALLFMEPGGATRRVTFGDVTILSAHAQQGKVRQGE